MCADVRIESECTCMLLDSYGVRLCVMKCCNHLLAVDMADVARDHSVWLGKMAKYVGTAIRKSIVVFLPCLVTFLRFHPYMLLHFVNAFL